MSVHRFFPSRLSRSFSATALVLVVAGLVLVGCKSTVQWRAVAVERGDISVDVTATGTLNPDTQILVGTQVSGTIARVLVDFNAHVKKGQMLAILDTTFLAAAVEDAAASLNKAKAQELLSRQTKERTNVLFTKGLAAQADVDAAVADYEGAKASLTSAQAELDRAKINLAYAYITSPISGVVVNRAVDVGQTVAASFSTPTLFTIANDLTRMQVQADIDEADIGQVEVGQTSTFTVDAYPDRKFTGTVSQIRLQPTTTQNVVEYTVIVEAGNPDLALLPGMTANITVSVENAANILKVPVAALKFMPPRSGNGPKKGNWPRRDSTDASKGVRSQDTGSSKHGWGGSHAHGDSTGVKREMGGRGGDHVFLLVDGKLKRIAVKKGLTNTGFAAVEGDIKEGDSVVVGVVSANKPTQAPSSSPLGGMPRRF